jgi:cytochrome c5
MSYPKMHAFRPVMRYFSIWISLVITTITLAAEAEPSAPQLMSGQQVYSNVCIACHNPPGAGGAPPLGDAEAWAPRISKGMDALNNNALNGFSGETGVMPKKGERLDLSDEEITRAVEYMVRQVEG